MNELSLFSGAGGGLLGTHLLGFRPVGYVEWNDYCQRVIAARVRDGYLPAAPIFGDIRKFLESGAARAYRGFVDVVTAGFPCDPFSSAGAKTDERHEDNRWPETLAVIRAVRPDHVLLENVTGLLRGYASRVAADLAALGYLGSNGVLSAADEGADHIRERVWFRCHANQDRQPTCAEHAKACGVQGDASYTECWQRPLGVHVARTWWTGERAAGYRMGKPEDSPERVGMDDGMAHRLDRLRAIGGGQIPAVVVRAWTDLAS